MNRALDVGTSVLGTLARFASGVGVAGLGKRPEQTLELWDFEGCPYCRKAREALSILDLEARIWPCPKGGPRYRNELIKRGGKAQFPYLYDPNTGKEMYESNAIVAYLFETYGNGPPTWLLRAGPLNDLTSAAVGLWRAGGGVRYRAASAPDKPLELYSFEASPFSRLVREQLCCLEIPYLLHNVAQNSPSRDAFVKRSGKMMVPYLVDPNTGREMFESADIVRYLNETYAD